MNNAETQTAAATPGGELQITFKLPDRRISITQFHSGNSVRTMKLRDC